MSSLHEEIVTISLEALKAKGYAPNSSDVVGLASSLVFVVNREVAAALAALAAIKPVSSSIGASSGAPVIA